MPKDVTDYTSLKKLKKPVTKTVPMLLDPNIGEQYTTINEEYMVMKHRCAANPNDKVLDAELAELARKRDAAWDEMQKATIEFVFKPVPRTKLDDLIEEYPPTPKQIKEANKRGEEVSWNTDKFPPAMIAAALDYPKLSVEEVTEMWDGDDWNQAELLVLFMAAMEVNQRRVDPTLKKG